MLRKKMWRELRQNFGQFFSIFLLAALAMAIYVSFEGHVLSENKARETFHDEANLSDLWVYSEGFTDEQLETIRSLSFVDSANLRTSFTGSAPDFDDAQVDIYLEREDVVNHPVLMEGEAFDPTDTEGVWLTETFANLRGIQVGDDFTISCKGMTFTKKVKGLVESAEYEYRQADGDADVYLENIAFVYMGYDAFPTKAYAKHLVEIGKISFDSLVEDMEESDDVEGESGISSAFLRLGRSLPDELGSDILSAYFANVSDEDMRELMPYTTMVIKTIDGGGLDHEDQIAKALDYDYSAIIDRDSIAGLARLDSEISQHQAFSFIFMLLFIGIAVLVIATSMKRMVEKQRVQIGTLNAMGMKRGKIMRHYVSFSLIVSFFGSIVGMLVGQYFGMPYMLSIFSQMYIVPGRKNEWSILYLFLILVITGICAAAAYFSCLAILKIQPAEALRPAPPKQGKNCIFEKLPFWGKLSFSAQYNLRDISRGKLRSFMAVVGCAVGMCLMVYGTACNGLLDDMLETSYEKSMPAAYQMKLNEDATAEVIDQVAEETDAELIMNDAVEVSLDAKAASADKKKGIITVLDGEGLYNLLDVNNEIANIPEGTIGVSRKFAEAFDVEVGDTICWHLYDKNDWYESKVGMIYRSSETQGIAMGRDLYESYGLSFEPTLLASDTDLSSYENESYVTSITTKEETIEAFKKSMEIVDVLIYFMIVVSAMLIVVVLYNSGSLSFNERVKELATLKVIGFQSSQIRKMMSEQNLWLSIVGILLGAPFGKSTFTAMMNSNGENFDYLFNIRPSAYIEAAIFVMAVSVLVGFMFSKRIKKLNMVEVLKGVE